ncbi:MAG: hypothetical protein HY811_11795 [Planctomycetes bacterium]|nr:hypothetical protein [Planctomycetota bacterium]
MNNNEFTNLVWQGSGLIAKLVSPIDCLVVNKNQDLSVFFGHINAFEDWKRDLEIFISKNISQPDLFIKEIKGKLELSPLQTLNLSRHGYSGGNFTDEIRWTKRECDRLALFIEGKTKVRDSFNDEFYYARNLLQRNYDKTKDFLFKQAKTDITSNHSCGPEAKTQCDCIQDIADSFSASNIFLDIPYSNYDNCEKTLMDLVKEVGLNPVIAKGKLTSNHLLCKVCKQIRICKYGVTDISTGSNSVSYEYGLMHGYGMKVCLLRREDASEVTDIKGLDHIPYNGLKEFKIKITNWILQNIIEADKTKAQNIIKTEENLLKEQGESSLQNNSSDIHFSVITPDNDD